MNMGLRIMMSTARLPRHSSLKRKGRKGLLVSRVLLVFWKKMLWYGGWGIKESTEVIRVVVSSC